MSLVARESRGAGAQQKPRSTDNSVSFRYALCEFFVRLLLGGTSHLPQIGGEIVSSSHVEHIAVLSTMDIRHFISHPPLRTSLLDMMTTFSQAVLAFFIDRKERSELTLNK
jgi:hypothetical protein